MKEILDEIEVKNRQITFSRLSIVISFITLGLFIYLIASTPRTIKASESLLQPSIVIIATTQIFSLIGVTVTIISFVRKEPSTWFKWLGGFINTLLILIFVGSVIFVQTI